MSNPYTDSPYAHERVGFDLHCEAAPDFPLSEGSIPKCIHCREEFEHHAEHPQPCIERIAAALEAREPGSRLLFSQRAALDRAGVPTSGGCASAAYTSATGAARCAGSYPNPSDTLPSVGISSPGSSTGTLM
jgi:hypothetical protein